MASSVTLRPSELLFEIDRESDRDIANALIEQTRRRAGTTGIREGVQELYWNFLLAAGVLIALGVLFLQLSAAAAVLVFVSSVF